jgi:hypothetical protein
MLLWIIGLLVFAYFFDYLNVKRIKQMPIWKGKHLRVHNQKQAIKESKSKNYGS